MTFEDCHVECRSAIVDADIDICSRFEETFHGEFVACFGFGVEPVFEGWTVESFFAEAVIIVCEVEVVGIG